MQAAVDFGEPHLLFEAPGASMLGMGSRGPSANVSQAKTCNIVQSIPRRICPDSRGNKNGVTSG